MEIKTMKKNLTMWMAALALMLSACGGSGGGTGEAEGTGSERPEAFDEMFAHVEEYYRVSAEQGRQAADAMDMEFWKEHRLGSLKFNVAVEDSLPPERPGAGVQGWQLQQRPVADGQREGDGRQRAKHGVPRVLSRWTACHGEVYHTARPQQVWRRRLRLQH